MTTKDERADALRRAMQRALRQMANGNVGVAGVTLHRALDKDWEKKNASAADGRS